MNRALLGRFRHPLRLFARGFASRRSGPRERETPNLRLGSSPGVRSGIALVTFLALAAVGVKTPVRATEATNTPLDAPQEVRCSECHTCATPTAAKPCLVPCPRPMPAQGPEVVVLKQLSSQYKPVIFAHRLHARMSEMSGGCAVCHHFNSTHRIQACSDCHSATQPGTILKPSLRGAYHRLCLKCHREWNSNTKCSVCHASKTEDSSPVVPPAPGDIMGMLHPDVREPVVKVFQTSCPRGRLVTFRHQEHIQRFGFQCADCHHEENCRDCHQPKAASLQAGNLNEMHARCARCHQTTGNPKVCAHCHSDQEIPPFSHKQVGLVLSADHKEIAKCTDCHVRARYRQKPTCSTCHEKDISYPAKLPGTKVKTP